MIANGVGRGHSTRAAADVRDVRLRRSPLSMGAEVGTTGAAAPGAEPMPNSRSTLEERRPCFPRPPVLQPACPAPAAPATSPGSVASTSGGFPARPVTGPTLKPAATAGVAAVAACEAAASGGSASSTPASEARLALPLMPQPPMPPPALGLAAALASPASVPDMRQDRVLPLELPPPAYAPEDIAPAVGDAVAAALPAANDIRRERRLSLGLPPTAMLAYAPDANPAVIDAAAAAAPAELAPAYDMRRECDVRLVWKAAILVSSAAPMQRSSSAKLA